MPTCLTKNVPLAPYTTFGIGGCAEYFGDITEQQQLEDVIRFAKKENLAVTVLGGGSNVLVDDAGVSGIVLRIRFLDRIYTDIDEKFVSIEVGAGVLLDDFVSEVVTKGYWGIENLSGIPGTIGAMPIQNVGAYGVEAKDVISHVTVFDQETGLTRELDASACAFGYRDSIFKADIGKSLIVLRVKLMLYKTAYPRLGYKDLVEYFGDKTEPTLEEIRSAILTIRSGKFPDWHVFGTAGSFFKNPIITTEQYEQLAARYPGIPGFATDDGLIKVPLGWILDRILGYRGLKKGNVGLYEKQALVLINYGGATSKEIFMFADVVRNKVKEKTEMSIAYEVVHLTSSKK